MSTRTRRTRYIVVITDGATVASVHGPWLSMAAAAAFAVSAESEFTPLRARVRLLRAGILAEVEA